MSTLVRLGVRLLRYRWQAAGSVAMAVVCIGLVLVLPTVTRQFIDVVIGQGRRDLLLPTAAVGVGAIVVRQLLFTLRTFFNQKIEQRMIHDLRVELYAKLQRLPVKWFDRNASGEIMSRVADDVPAMERLVVEGLDQALSAALQFVIIVGWMGWHSWQLTLVTLAPLPVIGVLTAWYSRFAEPRWRASAEASSALNSLLHDSLAGIRQIKAYTGEPEALGRFDAASRRVRRQHMRVMKGQAIVWPGVSLLAESGIILMIGCGAWWVLDGRLESGVVIAFLVAWGFLFDPISRINPLTQTFLRGSVAAGRVHAILDTPDEPNLTVGERPAEVRGEVVFEGVAFAYDPEAPAVEGISLVAAPGRTVALVGPTGAGKSTLLNLLTRFYEPDRGRILLDGRPLAGLAKEWLRDRTGYVTQESFLFNTTLRENLRLGRADAADDEIWEALEAANAAGFVRELPEGLDTRAGERGIRFSGGEKQRLSIARALLKNPPLLLLDEATSALDTETERLVREALDRLRADRTCFVIAHRLSTVRTADLICVMDEGRIVERGDHAGLVAAGGLYATLCRASLRDG